MERNDKDYLIYRAYAAYLDGDPVDACLYMALTAIDVSPEGLLECFMCGCSPPFTICEEDPAMCVKYTGAAGGKCASIPDEQCGRECVFYGTSECAVNF